MKPDHRLLPLLNKHQQRIYRKRIASETYRNISKASSFSANNIQQSSQPNPQTSNFGSSNIDEQRIRMLEFQMMQNMSMNNMLANQQMQMMMQQQQMMQQSFLHSTAGFSTYPHIAIPRQIPPPPGYVPNVIPNSAPNGIYAPPGVSYHHPQYHRQFQPPPYPQFNAAQNLQHQNVNQSYNSQHIQKGPESKLATT
ncbi:unnamed protein product [Mytilus coruscus]|uniref:Uncharacterized protein n=1 Tax=Mytilus coruscus TaxID=42192 RepID=A0A6J8E0R5_MYTCO|nr:unnamed protein product [Mytilus coruscus]